MCDITNKLSQIRTGYKIVAMNEQGEFFSILTGQQYQLGKVQDPPYKVAPISDIFSKSPELDLFKDWPFYSEKYIGKTSAFLSKSEATGIYEEAQKYPCKEGYTYQIIEISFEGDVYISHSFIFHRCITGSEISSMKLID